MSNLLFDEPPIAISPTLAAMFTDLGLDGLSAVAYIQQIHMSTRVKANNPDKFKSDLIDGYYWCYNSYAEWVVLFPFLGCTKTLQRLSKKLEELGVVVTAQLAKSLDRRNRTRIDEVALDKLRIAYLKKLQNQSNGMSHAHRQFVRMGGESNVPVHRDKKSACITKRSSKASTKKKSPQPPFQGGEDSSQGDSSCFPKFDPDGFNLFMAAYPAHARNFPKAAKEWDKLKPTKEVQRNIFTALSLKRQSGWGDSGGQRVIYAHTYLKEAHWKEYTDAPEFKFQRLEGYHFD